MGALHPADRLQVASDRSGSLACVGLDPRPALVPPAIAQAALARHGDTAEAVAEAFSFSTAACSTRWRDAAPR